MKTQRNNLITKTFANQGHTSQFKYQCFSLTSVICALFGKNSCVIFLLLPKMLVWSY